MVDDKLAKPSGGPASSPTRGGATAQGGSHANQEPFSHGFYVTAAAAIVSTVILACFSVVKTGVAPTIASVLATLASIATILGLMHVDVPKLPPVTPRVTKGAVYSILIVNVSVGLGWSIWSLHQANRAIDVLTHITLSGNVGMRADGAAATLDVPITTERDGIVLVFHVADQDPNQGNCAPYAELLVTRRIGGETSSSLPAIPGRSVTVDLPPGTKNLQLGINIKDTDRIQNCEVNLSVSSAKLKNR